MWLGRCRTAATAALNLCRKHAGEREYVWEGHGRKGDTRSYNTLHNGGDKITMDIQISIVMISNNLMNIALNLTFQISLTRRIIFLKFGSSLIFCGM